MLASNAFEDSKQLRSREGRHSPVRNVLHLRAQALPGMGKIGQHKGYHNSNANGDGSLNNVQPLPWAQATLATKTVQDASGDEVTESTGDQRAGVEDRHAEIEFLLCIPFRQVKQHSGEKWRFCS